MVHFKYQSHNWDQTDRHCSTSSEFLSKLHCLAYTNWTQRNERQTGTTNTWRSTITKQIQTNEVIRHIHERLLRHKQINISHNFCCFRGTFSCTVGWVWASSIFGNSVSFISTPQNSNKTNPKLIRCRKSAGSHYMCTLQWVKREWWKATSDTGKKCRNKFKEGSTLRFEHYALRKGRNIHVKLVANLGSDVFWKNVVVTCKRWMFKDQQVDTGQYCATVSVLGMLFCDRLLWIF
jgi:hypothetical protein